MKIISKKSLLCLLGFVLFMAPLLAFSRFYLANQKSDFSQDAEDTTVLNSEDNLSEIKGATTINFPEFKQAIDFSKKRDFMAPIPTVFGYSVKGKKIEGYIFGEGSDVILMFGAIHGNEKGTYALMQTLVGELSLNPSLVGLDKQLIIIPLVNPDGYLERADKLNANGVNLNLNFQTTDWKDFGGEGTYAGPHPFSEPESRLIRDVVLNYKVKKMIAYHSKASVVNPEIHGPSEVLARWYANLSGYRYFDDPSWYYFGTATRWFTETIGGPAITVELNNHKDSDWHINKKPILQIIK
jgi:murein peptide amidase A